MACSTPDSRVTTHHVSKGKMGVNDIMSPGVGTTESHNSSAQQGVEINPDPVLDFTNEHHHAHVHHGTTAVSEGKDDLMFAKSTENYTGSAAAPDYKVRPMSSNEDEESGGGVVGEIRSEDEKAGWKSWTFKRVYRQYKMVFHLAIWAVWTA